MAIYKRSRRIYNSGQPRNKSMKCSEWDFNPGPTDSKSNTLTTRPPCHPNMFVLQTCRLDCTLVPNQLVTLQALTSSLSFLSAGIERRPKIAVIIQYSVIRMFSKKKVQKVMSGIFHLGISAHQMRDLELFFKFQTSAISHRFLK